jgi:hypothetical protein
MGVCSNRVSWPYAREQDYPHAVRTINTCKGDGSVLQTARFVYEISLSVAAK